MKTKFRIALVIAAIAFVCLVGWNSKAQRLGTTNWEYKVVTKWHHPEASSTNIQQLNDMGDEGWDLVTVISEDVMRGNLRHTKLSFYFKRPA